MGCNLGLLIDPKNTSLLVWETVIEFNQLKKVALFTVPNRFEVIGKLDENFWKSKTQLLDIFT